MLAEPEIVSFNKTYRYSKKEQSPFFTKYTLLADNVILHRSQVKHEPKIILPKKEAKVEKNVKNQQKKQVEEVKVTEQDWQSSEEESIDDSVSDSKLDDEEELQALIELAAQERHPYKNMKNQRRKVQMTMQELEQLKQYKKLNLKNIKVISNQVRDQREHHQAYMSKKSRNRDHKGDHQKKKKYNKVNYNFEENFKHSNKEGKYMNKDRNHKQQKKNQKKQHKQKRIFDDYLSLEQIQKSLKEDQNKYFKGRVQYGEGPKYRAKIVSEECDGNLLIEGKHRNRTIHNDKVFFQILNQQKERTYCKVVHVIDQSRQVVGKVQFIASKVQYILTPINSRIVSMNVDATSVTKQVKDNMSTHYFRVEVKGWDVKSEYPECKIVQLFGKFGQIQTQTGALLRTNGVEDVQHDDDKVRQSLDEFLSRMNEKGQYEILEEQIAKREDLRKKRIFTIDPLNARDFDDALSFTPDGEDFLLGVHIADASYFCKEGSYVDQQARKRTTSVYLVHRVIPMLPRVLCENFCSLNPGRERLTFSLWVKLNNKGQIINEPRVSRSVIKSCARFTYEQAQDIIEGKVKSQKDLAEGFGCVDSEDFEAVASDIKLMHKIAALLRDMRIRRGSLFFDVPKKVFQLDENKKPLNFKIYERKQAHFLVEQYMILANELIGSILVKETKENAVLRRHRYPGPKKIARFEAFMKKIGLPFEFTRQTRIQDLINEILAKKDLQQSIKDLVKYEMIGLLEAADYFIVGKTGPSTWVHYALNSPVYTHFTSPIRRYPDILVHRQLAAILEKKVQKTKIPTQLIEHCNERKLMAKRVSSGCEKIFMCLYLKQHKANAKAIVSEAQDWGIRVCIPSFDFKGVLRFKQIAGLTVTSVSQDAQGCKKIDLLFRGNIKFTLRQYSLIQVQLDCNKGFPMDYKLSFTVSDPKNPGQAIVIG